MKAEEVYGETMKITKGNMQHCVLTQPTAESVKKMLGLMFIKSVV